MTTRKVVKATFVTEYYFPIPVGLDLTNDPNVKSYGVNWNILYIYFRDGTRLEIEPVIKNGIDLKYPCMQEIVDIDDEEDMDYLLIDDKDLL